MEVNDAIVPSQARRLAARTHEWPDLMQ